MNDQPSKRENVRAATEAESAAQMAIPLPPPEPAPAWRPDEPADPTPNSGCSFDLEAALELTDGDPLLVSEMARTFCEISGGMMAALKGALGRKDAPAVRIAAHTLKGATSQLAAQRAADAAKRLENDAAAGDWLAIEQSFGGLEAEIIQLLGELAAYARRAEP